MRKTFYTVDYNTWGRNVKQTATFDNLADAKNFAQRDYTDNVVTHTVSKAETIEHFEHSAAETYSILSGEVY